MDPKPKTANATTVVDGSSAQPNASADQVNCGDIDFSLLEDSLSKTPWERMQANDDALRFAEMLRAAMEHRNAKP